MNRKVKTQKLIINVAAAREMGFSMADIREVAKDDKERFLRKLEGSK